MKPLKPYPYAAFLVTATLVILGCSSDRSSDASQEATPAVADTIYAGGPIITANNTQPNAEAVAVRDGMILAVGSLAAVAPHRGAATVDVDLAGQTLAPGFIDGHAHVAQFGLQSIGANLLAPPDGNVQTIDDIVTQLQRFASGPDVGLTGWIFGVGYDDSVLAEGRHPTRDDLDKVSTELPVIAVHISGHFAAVNSKGLEIFGYNAESEDPEGGIVRRRDGSTEPNGVLEELAAIPLMLKYLSPGTPEDAMVFMQRGIETAMSYGHTTAQEGRAFSSTHNVLAGYAESTDFPIDIVSYIDYADSAPLESAWHSRDYRNGYRVGGMKITLDGSPQGRTAWRTVPYLLPPDGQDADYVGYPAMPDEAANAAVDTAYANDWQVLVHANGDAAVDQMLNAVSAATEKYGGGDRRTTLIHGQYVRLDQLDRMADLGVWASLFPMHTFYWGDWHKQIIGDELGNQISPTRSTLDRGIPLTSHTDAPVALPNLMQVMWATVNRTSRSGAIIGPDERLTPDEAFAAITLAGARQHFEEASKGSIEVGKRADMVILSDNPLTVDVDKINQVVVLETIKDGHVVWQRYPSFDKEFIEHMHRHAEYLDAMNTALAEGNFDAAMTPAYWLSRHDEVDGIPAEWRPYLESVREAARNVEDSTDLESARAAAEPITEQCQGCHTAAGVD
jgi:predicted amidohydrolase YtcJ